ncbi:hypothetical protein P167DRAFT_532780 [Morchella conica CCBAS932]|uniref:Uncharacterized protein n=1 Tax=Morchella conica CCBAS932 TaxID=1392247 RepID=A0A3N4KZ49_9PEZI|nr:hypothetical protein P167DRAFT_532780 [Morchella conica CCBAS932]
MSSPRDVSSSYGELEKSPYIFLIGSYFLALIPYITGRRPMHAELLPPSMPRLYQEQ